MCILIKVLIRKKSGNLFNDPRVYIYIYILDKENFKNQPKSFYNAKI